MQADSTHLGSVAAEVEEEHVTGLARGDEFRQVLLDVSAGWQLICCSVWVFVDQASHVRRLEAVVIPEHAIHGPDIIYTTPQRRIGACTRNALTGWVTDSSSADRGGRQQIRPYGTETFHMMYTTVLFYNNSAPSYRRAPCHFRCSLRINAQPCTAHSACTRTSFEEICTYFSFETMSLFSLLHAVPRPHFLVYT